MINILFIKCFCPTGTTVLGDDVSLIISEDAGYGVARETENIMKEMKKKDADGNPERKVVGWEGKLIPKDLVISELFPEEKRTIDESTELAAETDSNLYPSSGKAVQAGQYSGSCFCGGETVYGGSMHRL